MTQPRRLPPAEYLRQRLNYDAETGLLRWREGRLAGKLTGQATAQGYQKVHIDGLQYFSHRLIWKMVHGSEPDFIDHRDGNRSNNRLANLRSVDKRSNCLNARLRCDNKYGVPGIRPGRFKNKNNWQARIKLDGREVYLGTFGSYREAVAARRAAERVLGFSPAHGQVSRPAYKASRSGPE